MYNKLFTKILDSSIWMEPTPTRIVWLTLIAAMDEDGFVQFASVGNLAHRALVPREDAEKAVLTLESPDPDSSDPEHEGRRIERVEGGWMVLNANKYRDIVTREVAKQQTRARVTRFRERKRGVTEVKRTCNGDVTPSEAVTASEAKAGTAKHTQARGLPVSIEQAKAMAGTVGVPPEYAETIFLEHDGASWEDGQGRPINNFASYIKSRFNNRTEKHAREEKRYQSGRGNYGKPSNSNPPTGY